MPGSPLVRGGRTGAVPSKIHRSRAPGYTWRAGGAPDPVCLRGGSGRPEGRPEMSAGNRTSADLGAYRGSPLPCVYPKSGDIDMIDIENTARQYESTGASVPGKLPVRRRWSRGVPTKLHRSRAPGAGGMTMALAEIQARRTEVSHPQSRLPIPGGNHGRTPSGVAGHGVHLGRLGRRRVSRKSIGTLTSAWTV